MSNLTPFGNNPNPLAPHSFFDMLNQVENIMFNSFQSVFTPLNNTSYTDQGQQYVFTLTLPNLQRENIQLIVEDQNLILTVKQLIQTNEELGQMYQSSSFSQSFSLHDIDADKITAQLNQETLTITLPKKDVVVIIAQKVENYPCIIHDDYHASKDAINYLISKGHRSIGFIGVGEYDVAVGIERKKGYLDALKENDIEVYNDYIQIGDFSHESAFKLTHQLMSLPNPPSAIFTVTDNLAIGCMEYLKENNYSIPNDVAIMGLGDLKISAYMTPRLTTIHYYFKTMGSKSANLLIQLIQSGKESSKNCESNFTFKYRLMERDSV